MRKILDDRFLVLGTLFFVLILSPYAVASVETPHSIHTSDNFSLTSRVAIKYDKSENELFFDEWGYMWSEKQIVDLEATTAYSVEFFYKPSADQLKDNKGKIWTPEMHVILAEGKRGKGDRIDSIGEYMHIKFPVDNTPVHLRIKGKGIVKESSETGVNLFKINEWNEIKININSSTISLYINDKLVIHGEKLNIPKKAHIGFETWSSADWRIKNLGITSIK